MSISKLRVHNHDVLVTREIEQAPIKTMVRELIQNAFEAELEYKRQHKEIDIYATDVELDNGEAVRKLTIKNNGVGMSANELIESTNLSASINKTMSRTNNYGIGAKVSGLRSNPAGMRYRSCKSGEAHEVTLMKENGFYGRYKDEENDDVFNVTDEYNREDLEDDWTEVVLYGHDDEDDTVIKPFGDELRVNENWLNILINTRYFRYPENTSITYHEGILSKNQGKRNLASWAKLIETKNNIKSETVDTGQDFKIHYVLNLAEGWNVHRHSAKSMGAVVYKNEMFDTASGSSDVLVNKTWGSTAPKLGIPFGSRDLCIFIELDDTYSVEMNNYRNEIQDSTGERVTLEEFGRDVVEFMPEWVKEFIDKERNKHTGNNETMQKRLHELLKQLHLNDSRKIPSSEGKHKVDIVDGTNTTGKRGKGNKKVKKRLIKAKLGGKIPAKTENGLREAPNYFFLTEKSEIDDKELNGYAAKYIRESNTVFINAKHRIYLQKEAELKESFAVEMSSGDGFKLVITEFQEEYAFNILSTIIHARNEYKQNRWDRNLFDEATSKPALTVSLAKDTKMIGTLKMRLSSNKDLKSIKMVINND